MAIVVLCAGVGASQLQRAFPSLGSTVAEKCAVQARDFGQAFRELCLVFVKEKIGDMNQPARLFFKSGADCRMRMAQRVHTNATQKIQVAISPRVPQIQSAALFEENLLTIVGRQQPFFFGTDDGREVHQAVTSVPHSSLVK